MLCVHWLITPFVMNIWVDHAAWVFVLTLISVLIFWALYFTAIEIEYPFEQGDGLDHYHAQEIQKEFNHQLLILIDPATRKLPVLSDIVVTDMERLYQQHE